MLVPGRAALINGEHIPFSIKELICGVVTQTPRVSNPSDRWDYDEVVTNEPVGKLVLAIPGKTWGKHEERKRWVTPKSSDSRV